MEFSSEGYDLDALSSGQEGVLEVGGGATTTVDPKSARDDNEERLENAAKSNDDDGDDNGKKKKKDEDNNDDSDDPEVAMMEMAADYKLQGNSAFQKRDWKEAMEFYGAAIRATPGMTGEALLELQSKWIEEETLRIRKEMAADDQKRREIQEKKRKGEKVDDDDDEEEEATSASAAEESKRRNGGREAMAAFRAPHHKYGKDLAVYHCNRAAAMVMLLQELPAEPPQSTSATDDDAAAADTTNNNTLETSYERVISDCTVAILLNPGYAKALARRAAAYEKTEQTDKALEDVRRAARLDPSNRKYAAEIERLRKLEEERMEKLKAETMEKLKDLGNSILGNFGLSLDNFKAEQDPKTGSYNIAFQQNK